MYLLSVSTKVDDYELSKKRVNAIVEHDNTNLWYC
jgi:hypothetical protein